MPATLSEIVWKLREQVVATEFWAFHAPLSRNFRPHTAISFRFSLDSFRRLFSRYFVWSFFRYRKPNKKPILILDLGENYEFYWMFTEEWNLKKIQCVHPFSFYKHYLNSLNQNVKICCIFIYPENYFSSIRNIENVFLCFLTFFLGFC